MDCREAEELLVPYLLGALDVEERRVMESHLDTCVACNLQLRGDGETVANLAFSVPQLTVPPPVKQALMAQIDKDLYRARTGVMQAAVVGIWGVFRSSFKPLLGTAAASTLVVGLVFGGLWMHSRIDQISADNKVLSEKVEAATESQIELIRLVQDQRNFVYQAIAMSTTPGGSVNMLQGTSVASQARGMMIVSRNGTLAFLYVLNLSPLPPHRVYQIWLIKDGQMYNAAVFTVDSTGFSQTVIIPVAPIYDFDGVGVTIEPAGGSTGPTGTSVLKGDF